jgi:hypothetical protein
MTDRDRQRELDRQVALFLSALEDGDIAAVDRIWSAAASDPGLEEALSDAAVELAAEYDRAASEHAGGVLEATLKAAMPTAEVIRPPSGPLSVAEVADQIRRSGAPGLTSADLTLNDRLALTGDPVPEHLGLSAVISWGARYGVAPRSYWKVFRQAALTLRLRRESAPEYRLAARPSPPEQPGGER